MAVFAQVYANCFRYIKAEHEIACQWERRRRSSILPKWHNCQRRSLCSMNRICSDMAGTENLFYLKQPGYLVVLRKQTSGSVEDDL